MWPGARTPHEGPRDFADRAVRSVPSSGSAIRQISDLYIALRYGKAGAPSEVAELKRLVRTFNPA